MGAVSDILIIAIKDRKLSICSSAQSLQGSPDHSILLHFCVHNARGQHFFAEITFDSEFCPITDIILTDVLWYYLN